MVCNAADTASLATRFLLVNCVGAETLVGFREKRCRKTLPVSAPSMTSLLSCSIDYYSDSVLCFDPQKLLSKLSDAFPNVQIDREDLSAKEVAWVTEYTEAQSEMSDDRKTMMQQQIAGKQRRIGPAYRFQFSDTVTGHVNRYSIIFKTDGDFGEDDAKSIREFMSTLGAGTISAGTAS